MPNDTNKQSLIAELLVKGRDFCDNGHKLRQSGYLGDLRADINYRKALKAFDEVLKIDSKNVDALNGKGSVLFNLYKHGKAMRVFDEVLKIDPWNADAHFWKQHDLFRQDNERDQILGALHLSWLHILDTPNRKAEREAERERKREEDARMRQEEQTGESIK